MPIDCNVYRTSRFSAIYVELSKGGNQAIALSNGESRTFIEDGDTIIMRGWAQKPGLARVGFGEQRHVVSGTPSLINIVAGVHAPVSSRDSFAAGRGRGGAAIREDADSTDGPLSLGA